MAIVNNLDLRINRAEIKRQLRLTAESSEAQPVEKLVQEAEALMRPRFVYKACYIQEKAEDAVVLENVRFDSRVLRKNLDAAEKVFPFVITLGEEIGERIKAEQDFLEQYYMDTIANITLQDAVQYAGRHLKNSHKVEKLSVMSVGSLQDWPIQQQRQLFDLLGDVEAAIGVHLLPSMLMQPAKTESGIFFPSEVTFFNCQLCPRENCPSRKAPFDPALARDYGVLDEN